METIIQFYNNHRKAILIIAGFLFTFLILKSCFASNGNSGIANILFYSKLEQKIRLDNVEYRLVEKTTILFNDGWAYRGAGEPHKIKKTSEKTKRTLREKDKKWCRWKKRGKNYYCQNKKTKKWTKLEGKIVNAKASRKIPRHGLYVRHSDTYYGAGSRSLYKDTYIFKGNRFETSNSTFSLANSRIDDYTLSSTYKKSDKKGSKSINNTPGLAPFNKKTTKSRPDASHTGKYKINDYTITFYLDNGKKISAMFFVDGNSIVINGTTYFYDNGKKKKRRRNRKK